MKLFAAALLALVCSIGVAQTPSYSTTFPLTENPICEANASGQCNWINGLETGAEWNNIATVKGLAYGPFYQSNGFNDGTAVLAGNWAWKQGACATDSNPTAVYGNTNEVEIRLNTTVTKNSITGYEFNCSQTAPSPGNPYCYITRWNGPLGNFTEIAGPSSVGIQSGQQECASNDGAGNLTLTVAGKTVLTAKDTNYKAGSPGIGIDNATSTAVEQDFGFSSFTATGETGSGSTGGGTGSGGATPPTVTVSWTAALPGTDPAVSYDIYRGGAEIGSATGTSYVDSSVVAGTTYTYCVTSVDASGNQSTQACAAAVTIPVATQTAPNPPTNVTATPN